MSSYRKACAVFVGASLAFIAAVAAAEHPLDSLRAHEYTRATEILRAVGHATDATLYVTIRLDEPAKDDVLAWREGDTIDRVAHVTLRESADLFEARVDLNAGEVLDFEAIDDAQSGILLSEWTLAQEIVKSDPDFQAALAKRGYTPFDPDQFNCLPLSPGYFAEEEFEGKRILRVQCLDLEGTRHHVYQRPIEGLTAVVDLLANEVLQIVDEDVIPTPGISGNYDEESLQPYRDPMNPIAISLPRGPSYTFDGSFVEWGPWRFHMRMDRRRGIVVSLATFDDRSVLYQASLSEMWVPYQDPAYGWFFKSYFDAGEYGFGLFGTELHAGIDCPAHADFYDQTLAVDDGVPYPTSKVMCLFERPTMTPVWRHAEGADGSHAGRAGRELVARMISAIGNYDYVFDFIFKPTGAMTVSIGSTGIDIVKGAKAAHLDDDSAADETRFGALIAPNLVGVYHDHFFSLRFDLDVDGTENHFVRDRIVPRDLADDHVRRSIWAVESTRVRTEAGAQLDIDMRAPEQWRVESTNARNAMGYPTGYALQVSSNALPLLSKDDYPLRRAGFAEHHLWVTPYSPEELFSAGDYPNQSKGGDGLPAWTARNRSIEGTDLVLWYTLGFHHLTAAEDWPVLPTHPKTVTLKPHNFFDRSQVINLAP